MENKYSYQPLFDHMHQEHGLILLESEMSDIITLVRKVEQEQVGLVFIPCEENDPRAVGGYNSYDGQSLCHVREGHVPVQNGQSDAIAFMNWTLQGDCMYGATDEDQWTHNETGESITTEQLYELFLKQKEVKP